MALTDFVAALTDFANGLIEHVVALPISLLALTDFVIGHKSFHKYKLKDAYVS